jgi:hypothetical protein
MGRSGPLGLGFILALNQLVLASGCPPQAKKLTTDNDNGLCF